MEQRFRALRLIAIVCKVLAWIALVGGVLLAISVLILGLVQGRVGARSPLLGELPLLWMATDAIGGLIAGGWTLLGTVVSFVVLYAGGEWIELGLAIEQNTRAAAEYMRPDRPLPPPTQAA